VVLGQVDFDSDGTVTGATGAYRPSAVNFGHGGLAIASHSHHRVLVWDQVPQQNGEAASRVLGQADFDGTSPNAPNGTPSASSLRYPRSVTPADDGGWVVTDYWNRRVLSYDGPIATAGASASAVLGQPDFSTRYTGGKAPDGFGFDSSHAAAVSADHLIVSARYNGRLLVLDKNKPGASSSAIAVIGKPDKTTTCTNSDCLGPATATSVREPTGVAVDAQGRLYVADRYRDRVLVYGSVPLQDGAAADFVLGQSSLETMDIDPDMKLNIEQPAGLAVHGDKLYVTELGHNRVTVLDLPITKNRQAASFVIGPPDFATVSAGTSAQALWAPIGVYTDGNRLFIAEYGNRRVLVYDPVPTANGAMPVAVLGQPDFDTLDTNGGGGRAFHERTQRAGNDGHRRRAVRARSQRRPSDGLRSHEAGERHEGNLGVRPEDPRRERLPIARAMAARQPDRYRCRPRGRRLDRGLVLQPRHPHDEGRLHESRGPGAVKGSLTG
jgi:hypothetical protein